MSEPTAPPAPVAKQQAEPETADGAMAAVVRSLFAGPDADRTLMQQAGLFGSLRLVTGAPDAGIVKSDGLSAALAHGGEVLSSGGSMDALRSVTVRCFDCSSSSFVSWEAFAPARQPAEAAARRQPLQTPRCQARTSAD